MRLEITNHLDCKRWIILGLSLMLAVSSQFIPLHEQHSRPADDATIMTVATQTPAAEDKS